MAVTRGLPGRLREAGVSRREAEVLEVLAERLSNADIARRLFVSERTVESHVSSLLRKLGVASRANLAEIGRSLATALDELPPALSSLLGFDAGPFVGRAEELGLSDRVLADGARNRVTSLWVVGEPGIGKTRLAAEIAQRAHSAGAVVLFGRCNEDLAVPYQPFLEALGWFVARLPDDGVPQRLGDAPGELTRLVPAMGERLLGQKPRRSPNPEIARYRLFESVRSWLACAGHPVVLVVDDVHWATTPTLQLLGHVAGSVEASRAVLLCTARNTTPDQSETLAALVGELERRGADSHQIALGGLQAPAVGELVERALQRRLIQPPEALAGALHRDTAGNPLFVRALLAGLSGDQEWPAADMPRTVAETVHRRLRRLPEELSQVLRAAAVVGLEFDLRLVARAGGHDELATLEALELADRAGLVEEAGVNRYRFVHALVRASLREELSESRRVRLHQGVGKAIEELCTDRLPEHYETLAHHYHEALEWEKALEYLAKAGDKAAAAYANHDAVAFYGRALEACEKLGEDTLATAAALAHRRALVQFGIGNFSGAAADFERKRAAAIALGDRSLEGVALAHRGMAEFFNHDFATAETTLRAALTVADKGFDQCRAPASLYLAALYLALGRQAEGDPLLAVVKEQEARLDPVGRGLWSWLSGRLLSFAGRFDEALAELERQRPAAEASMANLLWHGWIEGCALAGRGDFQAALARLDQTLATCERVGDVIIRMRLLNTYGWVYGELQDHRRALEWNRKGLAAIRDSGTPMAEVEMHTLLNLAENCLALGCLDEADEYFSQVEEVVRRPLPSQLWVHWRYSERFFHSYGELALAHGDAASALTLADECLDLAGRNGSMKPIVKARRLRGQALLAQGRLELADQELRTAVELARQVANPPQLWKTYVALGELRRAQGRTKDARQAYRDAYAVIKRVAAGLTDESLRETFLASDHVQGIRDAAASPP